MSSTLYTITILIIAIVFIAIMAGIEINFNPFSIRFEKWPLALGVILITIGLMIMVNSSKNEGYKSGYSSCVNDFKEIIGTENTKFILEESLRLDKEKFKKNNPCTK